VLTYISRIILTLTVITGAALLGIDEQDFEGKACKFILGYYIFRLLYIMRLTITGFYSGESNHMQVCYVKHCHTII